MSRHENSCERKRRFVDKLYTMMDYTVLRDQGVIETILFNRGNLQYPSKGRRFQERLIDYKIKSPHVMTKLTPFLRIIGLGLIPPDGRRRPFS